MTRITQCRISVEYKRRTRNDLHIRRQSERSFEPNMSVFECGIGAGSTFQVGSFDKRGHFMLANILITQLLPCFDGLLLCHGCQPQNCRPDSCSRYSPHSLPATSTLPEVVQVERPQQNMQDNCSSAGGPWSTSSLTSSLTSSQ